MVELTELEIEKSRYKELFEQMWERASGFTQLDLRVLNNFVVKIIKLERQDALSKNNGGKK